jgi:hypothetical protein
MKLQNREEPNPFSFEREVGRLIRICAWTLAGAVVVILIAIGVSGCTTSRSSPLGEMMALSAQGEIACVRHDVVMRGKACK